MSNTWLANANSLSGTDLYLSQNSFLLQTQRPDHPAWKRSLHLSTSPFGCNQARESGLCKKGWFTKQIRKSRGGSRWLVCKSSFLSQEIFLSYIGKCWTRYSPVRERWKHAIWKWYNNCSKKWRNFSESLSHTIIYLSHTCNKHTIKSFWSCIFLFT